MTKRALQLFAVAAGLFFVAGCAMPEARLRAGLINAGLSPALATCMAERMVDRLSLAQLRRIADLPDARESQSVDQFLRRARALRDPELLTVSAAAATLCATGLAG